MSIFARLFKLFLFVIFTPLFAMGAFLFFYQNYSKTEVLANYYGVAQISADFIKQNIENISLRFDFANDLNAQNAASQQAALDLARRNSPDFIFLALLDESGLESARSAGEEISKDISYLDFSADEDLKTLTTDNVSVSGIDTRAPFPLIEVTYPLKNGGYLFALVNLYSMWDKFTRTRIGRGGGIYFADAKEGFLEFNDMPAPLMAPQQLQEIISSGSFLIKGLRLAGAGNYAGAWAPTPVPDLFVFVLQYQKEAFYTINLITWLIIFFILVTTTLSYFAALSFSQEVSEPVEQLTAAAREIGGNNFDVHIPRGRSWGEFELLIKTINEMAARLNQYQAVQFDKLLDEKKKFDMLAGHMQDGLIMCALDGRSLFINKAANRILASGALCGLLNCAQGQTPALKDLITLPAGAAFDYQSSTGRKKRFEVISQTFRPAGEEEVALIILRDITTEHEINEMKNNIFNSVAHDLRAPLLGLQAYIMILAES
ncbi:MAG: HAMP domain-containing protein, partial [Elusimicrobiota bacterium]|nr:HAMP domain-containing protein [Elusimicrobiota bacterium]